MQIVERMRFAHHAGNVGRFDVAKIQGVAKPGLQAFLNLLRVAKSVVAVKDASCAGFAEPFGGIGLGPYQPFFVAEKPFLLPVDEIVAAPVENVPTAVVVAVFPLASIDFREIKLHLPGSNQVGLFGHGLADDGLRVLVHEFIRIQRQPPVVFI